MIDTLKRWAIAQVWRLQGRVQSNRALLYAGSTGLRIIVFHKTGPQVLPQFRNIVQWCRDRFPIASPDDADALFNGSFTSGSADRILITFDDGFQSNYEAAAFLASLDIRAMFFVVPSLIDRSVLEYLEFHRRNGVTAYFDASGEGGLTTSQVREMLAMGHRIAAHNFAHRNLGVLHNQADLKYEIDNALDAVSDLTGAPCQDFAVAFGQPTNISAEATTHLRARCPRVYCCFRGLNVPGKSPRFALRHDCGVTHPISFTRICIEGGADHSVVARAREMSSRVQCLPRLGSGAC